MSVFGEIYTTGKNFYNAGGSNGSDKSHLWSQAFVVDWVGVKLAAHLAYIMERIKCKFEFIYRWSDALKSGCW